MTKNPRSLTIDDLKTICVVGAGTMGAQIAQVAALSGYKVYLTDPSEAALTKAVEGNYHQLQARVKKGKISQPQADDAWAAVKTTTSLEEAAGTADFVIEAVPEDLTLKREIFRRLENICPAHTVLVSNSATLLISKIGSDLVRKDKTCNMHFFHPALVMQLVEVVRGPETSDETVTVTTELGRRLGKEVVVMQKEVFGVIVNNGLSFEMDPTLHLYDHDHKTVEHYDKNRYLSLNRPANPSRYRETSDPRDTPPTFLEELVKEGR